MLNDGGDLVGWQVNDCEVVVLVMMMFEFEFLICLQGTQTVNKLDGVSN